MGSIATHTQLAELDGELVSKNASIGFVADKTCAETKDSVNRAQGTYEARMEYERKKMENKLKAMHAAELKMVKNFNVYERQEEEVMQKQMEYILDKGNETHDQLPNIADMPPVSPVVLSRKNSALLSLEDERHILESPTRETFGSELFELPRNGATPLWGA